MVALAALAVAGGTVPATAQQAGHTNGRPGGHGAGNSVTAGKARFQVLSPTLIRTEYAGDARFLNAATFNVIGRNTFRRTQFTSGVTDGWLTIRTSELTMRYRLGSGPFTAKNLTVRVADGAETVTATPWNKVHCTLAVRCEAEAARFVGLTVATDHRGFTGDGFLAGYTQVGNSLTVSVDVPTAGTYQFSARYANGFAGDNQHIARTLTVGVDDGPGQQVQLPATDNWDAWKVVSAPVELTAGTHRVSLSRGTADSGNVNVDSVAVDQPGTAFPAVAPAADCRFGTVCEAETGTLSGSAIVGRDHAEYTGTGFVAELNQGAGLSTDLVGVPAAGAYTLHLRYANGRGGDNLHEARTATLAVGGGAPTTISLPATENWDAWSTVGVPVTLPAGDTELAIGCPEATSCHVNTDTLAVTPAGAPMPTPHAALGGYRRSVDLVNGEAPTTPGLLHKDGWYLLDDTQSALYDPRTSTLTARPDHGTRPYQDGYVFGYGNDYKQGLSDLATLTGPSMLLPRWAYGVWYSEYYDRTAADYQDTILPMFRSAGVPLDVLVTDTDFKAPSTWNGWQIDPKKFPDPEAYFAWLHAQGVFTTFNIHSTIDGSDPQFAQAQATAKGKLLKRPCSDPLGCYEFNWADPDQLKAYFDLHQPMERQGVDFWWLDLCCDASRVHRDDVTSDAWINQKYAEDTSKNIGRGFAFSRAYGTGPENNQPNLPTGPWADKRTTVHFTGDTSATWRMLAAEVGSTPAESAATGLSAVSHDIGGFNNPGDHAPGAEPGSTKLPDDLYARWVQFGAFQPIDRLHGNHSDRLPWQYGPAARTSAERFLNLREALVPYTYTLAEQASRTGVPVVRATYLEYPDEPAAYAAAGKEYLYGPDVLVAPVTSPGTTATASVWFPPGEWTDYFTGETYQGGTTETVTTDLNTMPVFLRSGGILATRSANVANDVQNPLNKVTLTVPSGSAGSFRLFEDDGVTTDRSRSATTRINYTEGARGHTLTIGPATGSFRGQVTRRAWTAVFLNASAPTSVSVNGVPLAPTSWTWDAEGRRLTVTVPERPVRQQTVISYR